jgi:type I restriction enzyme S subunit
LKVHADAVNRCVLWFLRRREVLDGLLSEMNQDTGVPTLGKAVLERILMAIPPVAEQRQIVSRVDVQMGLLDRLEQRLAAKGDAHKALAAAAIHHLEA